MPAAGRHVSVGSRAAVFPCNNNFLNATCHSGPDRVFTDFSPVWKSRRVVMKVMQVLVPALVISLLTGCAAADMDRRLTSWKGAPFDELVRAWDSPTSREGNRYIWKQSLVDQYGREVECWRIVDLNDKRVVDRLELQGDCKWFNANYEPFGGNPKTTPPLQRSI
jgi:hypothetical protein